MDKTTMERTSRIGGLVVGILLLAVFTMQSGGFEPE